MVKSRAKELMEGQYSETSSSNALKTLRFTGSHNMTTTRVRKTKRRPKKLSLRGSIPIKKDLFKNHRTVSKKSRNL
jgi:hypothetical protein